MEQCQAPHPWRSQQLRPASTAEQARTAPALRRLLERPAGPLPEGWGTGGQLGDAACGGLLGGLP